MPTREFAFGRVQKYPPEVVAADPQQQHPDVQLLRAAIAALDAARPLLLSIVERKRAEERGAPPMDLPMPMVRAVLAHLALCVRLERECLCLTLEEVVGAIHALTAACPEMAPSLVPCRDYLELPAVALLGPIAPGEETLQANAFAVYCEIFPNLLGELGGDALVQQLSAAHLHKPFVALDPVHLPAFLASMVPFWRRPINLLGELYRPGANVWLRMRELLGQAIVACQQGADEAAAQGGGSSSGAAAGAAAGGGGSGGAALDFASPRQPWRLGELLWQQAACVARGGTEADRLEARGLLLRSVRCTPPGAEYLRNAYLRLAGLVYSLATGLELGGALAVGGREELSGAEAVLMRTLLERAEEARVATLAVHRIRLAARSGAGGDDQIQSILQRYDGALRAGGTCEGCGMRGAQQRCDRCGTVFCSAKCFEAAWRERPGVAPHKRGCKLLARARAQVLEMAQYRGARAALDVDVELALGKSWRLLHPASVVHTELPHLD